MSDDLLKVSRRKFGLALSGATVLSACSSSTPSSRRTFAGRLDELVADEPFYFDYGDVGDAFLLLSSTELEDGIGPQKNLVAFIAVCTHMGCALPISSYDREEKVLECFCHQSRFDPYRNGIQTAGRATQSLVRLDLDLDEDGQIFAALPAGLPVGAPLTTATIERLEEGSR